jgi:hypothetical protein
MAKPTTVVTRIGPDRPIWWVVAYKMSSGEISRLSQRLYAF